MKEGMGKSPEARKTRAKSRRGQARVSTPTRRAGTKASVVRLYLELPAVTCCDLGIVYRIAQGRVSSTKTGKERSRASRVAPGTTFQYLDALCSQR